MKAFVLRWLCTTVAVAVAAHLTGVTYSGFGALLIMALLLGLVNAFIRPVLLLLSLPFIVITLGFFILIVNTLLFWLVSALVPGFAVSGFWQAFFAALIVSFVNWVLSSVFRTEDGQYRMVTSYVGIKQANARVIDSGADRLDDGRQP